MSNLVLLSGEREKREEADQAKLVAGLQELLAMAESGQIKAICYAALDSGGDNFTVGVLRGENTGHHEMINTQRFIVGETERLIVCASPLRMRLPSESGVTRAPNRIVPQADGDASEKIAALQEYAANNETLSDHKALMRLLLSGDA